jgi:6-pyruvoyltetrahydropterin/6-carboxytetrahydropterin synthase
MFTISKRFAFSASHVIGGLPPDHPCARLHGHNYEVEIVLEKRDVDAIGFVRDYRELSAEVIAQFLYAWCKTRWPETAAVRVSETPRTWAEYRP